MDGNIFCVRSFAQNHNPWSESSVTVCKSGLRPRLQVRVWSVPPGFRICWWHPIALGCSRQGCRWIHHSSLSDVCFMPIEIWFTPDMQSQINCSQCFVFVQVDELQFLSRWEGQRFRSVQAGYGAYGSRFTTPFGSICPGGAGLQVGPC